MKKFIASALLVISTFGGIAEARPFTSHNNIGTDGYVFESKQYQHSSVKVTIVTFQKERELREFAKTKGYLLPNRTVAFSVLEPEECTIYVVDPDKDYQPESLGHELAHCFFGNWHPGYDKYKVEWRKKQ